MDDLEIASILRGPFSGGDWVRVKQGIRHGDIGQIVGPRVGRFHYWVRFQRNPKIIKNYGGHRSIEFGVLLSRHPN